MARVFAAGLLCALALLSAPAHARERAPGAPGGRAAWAPADKQGFGTSATPASRVWFTLRKAQLTELYYPDLSHPSARSLDFMVDGQRVDERSGDEASGRGSGLVTHDTLTYRQTS